MKCRHSTIFTPLKRWSPQNNVEQTVGMLLDNGRQFVHSNRFVPLKRWLLEDGVQSNIEKGNAASVCRAYAYKLGLGTPLAFAVLVFAQGS